MATQRSSPFKPIPTKTKEIYKNAGRPIMSRQDRHSIGLVASLMPSQFTPGCLICCSAPACCPLCAVCPCCGDAEYIAAKRKASTYIFIRENSIEWNDPKIVMQTGVCCGVDPCMYDVQDSVQVLYFDDITFDSITDQTRFCNEFLTCVCGGKGERVQIDSPTCCGCCQRGSAPCLCIPFCCPQSICPCILRHEIYVQDAQKAIYEIKKARKAAAQSELLAWEEECKDKTEV